MTIFGSLGLINNVKVEQSYMRSFLNFLLEQNAYTTKSGDNLSKIARDNNLSLAALLKLNPQIKDANKIGIGDSINIPGAKQIVGPMITTRDYANRMIQQGEKFRKFGREPNKPGYDKKYDYGGSGDVPHDTEAYGRVMGGVVRGMMDDLKIKENQLGDPATRERLVTRYRGATRADDPRYFSEFDKTYKAGGKNCVGSFCDAIIQSETGSFKDPFIRTVGEPESSSTAWGPGQMTASLKKGTLPDMVGRHPQYFSDKDPREK
jgi:LysM repeat protein